MENLLERSTHVQLLDGSVVMMDETTRSLILEELLDMSLNSLRCLGFAYKTDLVEFANYDGEAHPAHKFLLDPANYSSIESNLIFAGLAGLRVLILPLLVYLSIHLSSYILLLNSFNFT